MAAYLKNKYCVVYKEAIGIITAYDIIPPTLVHNILHATLHTLKHSYYINDITHTSTEI